MADASHELRTPLMSLTTNIEVLASGVELDPVDRRGLLDDLSEQLDEFGRLIAGVVELARGDRPARAATPVRLDHLVEEVVSRTERDSPGIAIHLDAQPTTVHGESDRLERAVGNLLENTVKYGTPPVEVTLADGTVTVRDHGPGIELDDRAHVFDRFYRAPRDRAAPGSGIGLSIVRQVAHAHGGTASVDEPEGGGTRFTLQLPS